MAKPELTVSKFLPNSKTLLREYGHSMASRRHKRIGEDLLLEWLLVRHPKRKLVDTFTGEIVEKEGLRNLDLLEDRALIEELKAYNRKGNFDTAMAMMGIVIQLNEHFNEDFLERDRMLGTGSVSDFWEELYVNKWGTARDKASYRERAREHKNNRRSVSYLEDV